MKKITMLFLTAGMLLGGSFQAQAVDFKAKGQWIMSFDYGEGSQFSRNTRDEDISHAINGWGGRGQPSSADSFSAQQRLRLQLDAIASETLSGTVFFELGEQVWGKAINGGALGTDGKIVEVKNAYLDWMWPDSDLKIRMGLQNIALPAFTTNASQIFSDDTAGIVLSNRFSDNVTLTGFWMRPYNDNYVSIKSPGKSGFWDNADFFGLLLPLSFDGIKVTPWVMGGMVSPRTLRPTDTFDADDFFENFGTNGISLASGMYPSMLAQRLSPGPDGKPVAKSYKDAYMVPFWAGFTGEVTLWDPLRLAFDVNYGHNGAIYEEMSRKGWYASVLAEYKLEWAIPGIYAWYSSGDDGDYKNGSERMPTIRANGNNEFSNFAGNGNPYIAREGILGMDLIGTWGVGVRLKDFSFLENLKHTLRINYINGTNSPTLVKYILDKVEPTEVELTHLYTDFNNTHLGNTTQNLYLTTQDHAMEIGLTTSYKLFDNFTIFAEAAYMALWLDKSKDMWGGVPANFTPEGDPLCGLSSTDAWNVNISFVYEF